MSPRSFGIIVMFVLYLHIHKYWLFLLSKVRLFLRMWRLPDCGGQYVLPMVHKLKQLAGITEEKISKKKLAERTSEYSNNSFIRLVVNVDTCGTLGGGGGGPPIRQGPWDRGDFIRQG